MVLKIWRAWKTAEKHSKKFERWTDPNAPENYWKIKQIKNIRKRNEKLWRSGCKIQTNIWKERWRTFRMVN